MATERTQPEHEQPTPEERHGALRPVPGSERRPRYGQPFFPAVPFGSAMYILATAIALFWLATHSPAPLQNPADPLNHEQINPRPEWYFLFLFQILKIFQGNWELVGTAVIPGVIGIILLGLPFYDRNWSRRAVRRPVAMACGILAILCLGYLTYLPIAGTASQQAAAGNVLTTVSPSPKWVNVQAIFAQNCGPCHISGGATAGLNLDTYANLMKGGNVAAGGVVNGAVVKPFNPDASYLWQAVAGKQKLGQRMPFGKNPISNVDIQNIYNWIKNGAKNQ